MTSLLFRVERRRGAPIWKQIVERITEFVDEGTLQPGDRLPPSRVLSRQLGVDRTTVCRAYEELWARGYLLSRQGAYSTVRAPARKAVPVKRTAATLIDWNRASSHGARACSDRDLSSTSSPLGAGLIDFASLSADPSLCPADDFRRSLKRLLADKGASLLDYGSAEGYRPLRELLARRLRAHGVNVSEDEVLVTQGAQHALDLAVRLLCETRSAVAVEVPTYGQMLSVLRLAGVRLLEIPVASSGMDLDVLERKMSRCRPALVYTIPTFQNPTGITTDHAHRERLISICEKFRVPIVEDGFEEDMKYFGRARLPIKSIDTRGVVLYVGTFSKVIFPGLRVGWIAADRDCIRRLAVLNKASALSGNTVAQAAVEQFCRTGRYDAYLRKLHATFRRRMVAMFKGLATHVTEERLEWTRPAGGCTLWGRVVSGNACEENRFTSKASECGVAVAPGSQFFPGRPDGLYVRLSIARTKTHEIDEGCRRLARAIDCLS